jgi:hypothetical protein
VLTFNPKGLYVTFAFVALMLLAISGNAIALAVALVAEGVKYFFALSGGFDGRARSSKRLG